MAGWLWMGIVGPVHASGDRAERLEAVEAAVLEGRWPDVEAASEALVSALACGGPAEPELVARLWLSEAVVLTARGELDAADEALAAAARVSPDTWSPQYGPTMYERWQSAARRPPPPSGQLRLEPLPPGATIAVDGVQLDLPATLPAGLHLLQVGAGSFQRAMVFDLPPDLELVLDPKLTGPVGPAPVAPLPRPVAPEPVAEPNRRQRRVVHALVVGGAGALVYGATFATSRAYLAQPEGQRDQALRHANNGLTIAAPVVGITSAALLVRSLATPAR